MKTNSIEFAQLIVERSFAEKQDLGGSPYLGHLFRVRDNSLRERRYLGQDLIIIALLHDLIEDCPEWNIGVLKHLFSKSVIEALEILTRKENEAYEAYIDRIVESNNGLAITVKRQDLLDNMDVSRLQTLESRDIARLQKYYKAYNKLKSL